MIFPHAGLLELSQQYTEWALKRKVEHLIKKGLSADNVADLYGVATKFNAKVRIHTVYCLGCLGLEWTTEWAMEYLYYMWVVIALPYLD